MDKFNLIIPAAGAATRLRPLSSNTSKVMVRVNGKPCLDYIIEAVNGDVDEIVVVDGQFDDIREYCKIKHPKVKFATQPKLKGPRDAIKIGMDALENNFNPVVVWLGDAIILEKGLPFGHDFLLTKRVEDQSAWCMWDGRNYYNKPEQPVENCNALVGLYSFRDGVAALNAFKHTDGYDISDALEHYTMDSDNQLAEYITDEWYDIGDLPTYYKTCASLLNTKARAFNNLHFDSDLGTIRKLPDYHDKNSLEILKNEKFWYSELTPEQSMFTPRILPHPVDLIMSYESGTLLSDLMLYDNIPNSHWDYIMDRIFNIKLKYFNERVTDMQYIKSFTEISEKMWIDKAMDRMSGMKASMKNKLLEYAREIHENTSPISGMHGDLHFGNILYNQQTDQFKLLDPRGEYGGMIGTAGDNIYDWAKLAHDCVYGYSAIVADVPQNEYVKELFIKKLDEYNLPKDIILKGGLLLLATCIPLHYDDKDRQKRMTQRVVYEI